MLPLTPATGRAKASVQPHFRLTAPGATARQVKDDVFVTATRPTKAFPVATLFGSAPTSYVAPKRSAVVVTARSALTRPEP